MLKVEKTEDTLTYKSSLSILQVEDASLTFFDGLK